MTEKPRMYLTNILEAIVRIESYTAETTKRKFVHDHMMQDAVIRQLEIIGEATKQLTRAFTARHPFVPWEDMAGMRDMLIHHYMAVDLDYVYLTAKKDIPSLKPQIASILASLDT
jgi:uncharacterized protein with HEPN domain